MEKTIQLSISHASRMRISGGQNVDFCVSMSQVSEKFFLLFSVCNVENITFYDFCCLLTVMGGHVCIKR